LKRLETPQYRYLHSLSKKKKCELNDTSIHLVMGQGLSTTTTEGSEILQFNTKKHQILTIPYHTSSLLIILKRHTGGKELDFSTCGKQIRYRTTGNFAEQSSREF
jgi:hypothetical protein